MSRKLGNWLEAYTRYAGHTEAPGIMHWWAGVSALAGALRRKVWVDQFYFQWTPCFFIIFVAPPGVVSKSTTADIAMDLLKEVPGIKFGPDIATWQSLVPAFAAACEAFEHPEGSGEYHPMSPVTLCASELGNLLDLHNNDMVNLFITLWDGKKNLSKITKMSGSDVVEAPWINMLGCTTPDWIAQNMNSLTVGGGFASRCIFVYADAKERFIAWPKYNIPDDQLELKANLIHDLEHISMTMCGEYNPTKEAVIWVEEWYRLTWTNRPEHLQTDRADGYIARRQTHLTKLAIVLAAAESDKLELDVHHFVEAHRQLTSTEKNFHRVFDKIGRSETSLQAERFIQALRRQGSMPYHEAYRMMHAYFPDAREFEGILQSIIRSGYAELVQTTTGVMLRALGDKS